MSNLRLSDQKANELILLLKRIFKKSVIDLAKNPKGSIKLTGIDKSEFLLFYNVSTNVIGKYSLNLMDSSTKCTLIRLNVCDDNNFHKNADGNKIHGNRVNIFSEEEYLEKGDGFTHYKAYKVPYETLYVHPEFSSTLNNFLEYTNTIEKDKLKVIDQIQSQLELF